VNPAGSPGARIFEYCRAHPHGPSSFRDEPSLSAGRVSGRHQILVIHAPAGLPGGLEASKWSGPATFKSTASAKTPPAPREPARAAAVVADREIRGALQTCLPRISPTRRVRRWLVRVPHYQRPRRRSRHPGGLGPRLLGDRKPASLVPRRDLSEDKSLVRTGNAARVMASLRRPAQPRSWRVTW